MCNFDESCEYNCQSIPLTIVLMSELAVFYLGMGRDQGACYDSVIFCLVLLNAGTDQSAHCVLINTFVIRSLNSIIAKPTTCKYSIF